jgi:hypothetical protein
MMPCVISDLLLQNPIDWKLLRSISRLEGGFRENEIRNRVWPKLLGVDRFQSIDFKSYICPHRDEKQIEVDIERLVR